MGDRPEVTWRLAMLNDCHYAQDQEQLWDEKYKKMTASNYSRETSEGMKDKKA